MRIAVVGSRGYKNLAAVRQFVREQDRNAVIVSGGAAGVDWTAQEEAQLIGMEYEVYLPDWAVHGRAAGVIRNRTIVEKSDRVVAFWDGRSAGTRSTIELAKRLRKPLLVFG